MKTPKHLTHAFHLNPGGSSSQLWSDPIHMASVFITFSFKPETFSKSLSNLSRACAEFKSAEMAVVSSVNWSTLVSKPVVFIGKWSAASEYVEDVFMSFRKYCRGMSQHELLVRVFCQRLISLKTFSVFKNVLRTTQTVHSCEKLSSSIHGRWPRPQHITMMFCTTLLWCSLKRPSVNYSWFHLTFPCRVAKFVEKLESWVLGYEVANSKICV